MILRYLGLSEQATVSQNPLPDATMLVDIDSANIDSPDDSQIEVPTGFGRSMRQTRPGRWMPKGNVVFFMDVRTIARVMRWILAGYAFTAGPSGGTPAAPTDFNTHEIWGSDVNELPLFCGRVGRDYFEHVFSGLVANKIQIEINANLVKVTLDMNASGESGATLKTATFVARNLPSEYPLAFHEVTAKIAGSDQSAIVKAVHFSIDNKVKADEGLTIGSRFTRGQHAAARETTLKLDLRYQDNAQLQRLWGSPNGPTPSLGATTFPMEIFFDGGSTFAQGGFGNMKIFLPRVYWKAVNQPVSQRDLVKQSVNGVAMGANITLMDGATQVYSDILATIKNRADNLLNPMPALT